MESVKDDGVNKHVIKAINKPINGLYFALDVKDANGKKISKMLFSPKAEPVVEVLDYLDEIHTRTTNRYNTLKRICYDLCHFHDFLIIMKFKQENLDDIQFGKFVDYLLTLDPDVKRHPKVAIDRSFWIKPCILSAYKDALGKKKVVVAIREGIGLLPSSISRIVRSALHYLGWLKFRSPYRARFGKLDLDSLAGPAKDADKRAKLQHGYITDAWKGYLVSRGIALPTRAINPVDKEKVFSENEISQFESQVKNPRDKFLFYILKTKGSRINELLELRWIKPPRRVRGGGPIRWDYSEIEGDILFNNNKWQIFIDQKKTNKSHWVIIEKRLSQEFERLLDRYLVWRSQQIVGQEDHGWVFVKRGGGKEHLSYYAIRQQFLRTKIQSGLSYRRKLSLHSFRHYKITNERNKGVPLGIVVQDTGHSPFIAEQIYRHFDPKIKEAYSEGVQDYLENPKKEL